MAEQKKDTRTFNERLMDAMAEMENPTKSKQAYKYKYETLEQVLGIVRPALVNHGLMLFQSVRWCDRSNGFVLETGVFGAEESRIMDERPFHTCDDAQAEGSWETYMRRYALRTAFGLTGEDDDGEATKYARSKTSGSERPTTAQKHVPKTPTKEETDALKAEVDQLAGQFAMMNGKETAEAIQKTIETNTVQSFGVIETYEQATYAHLQAMKALLCGWIEKLIAQEEADAE